MGGRMAAALAAGILALGAARHAFSATAGSGGVTVSNELAQKLAQRELELRELKARLELIDDEKWLVEAKSLGIVEVLAKFGFTSRLQRRIAVAITKYARAQGLDPLVVVAVIQCESSFNPYAKSRPGAMGLMQLMPATGKWMALKRGFPLGRTHNLYDAELNIELGTAYLAELIHQFGSLERALVAYNAGPSLAKKILAQKEARKTFTNGYPRKVLHEFGKLKAGATRKIADRSTQASGQGTAG